MERTRRATLPMLRAAFALTACFLIWPQTVTAEDFVKATASGGAPIVCRLDGVDQSPTYNQPHTRDTAGTNLKLSNPDATVICEQTVTIVYTLTTVGRAMVDAYAVPPIVGSITLNWGPPTENEDGSTLTDLAGYKIYFGENSGSYENDIDVPNAAVTNYIVEGLTAESYAFVVTAYSESGIESTFSNEVVKTVN